MKNYHHCVVMKNGEFYREDVTTTQSAKQQGEKLWKTIPHVFLVEVKENLGKDYYIRNR